MIPKEPGKYKLGDYFQWVFFNPKTASYDTLKSKLTVNVTGESKKNEAILANDGGNFYNKIASLDNRLVVASNSNWTKWAFNGFILVMLGASVYLVIKK
jgi:hypothetical protein